MRELISLGFTESEVHRVVADSHCRLFVPIRWYDEEGYLSIATSTRLDLALNGAGLRSGRIPIARERAGFSVYLIEEQVVLGQYRPAGEVTAFDEDGDGNVFGRLGALFFQDAALALDPAGPLVAVSREWIPPAHVQFVRLNHIGHSGLPLTDSIQLRGAPPVDYATLVSSDSAESYVTEAFPSIVGHKVTLEGTRVTVRLPGGTDVGVTFGERRSPPEYAVDLGHKVAVVLGINFLRRFFTVLDFRGRTTFLRPYGSAI